MLLKENLKATFCASLLIAMLLEGALGRNVLYYIFYGLSLSVLMS